MLHTPELGADRYVGSDQSPYTDDTGQAEVKAVVPASTAVIDILTTAAVRLPLTAPENRGATTRYIDLKRAHSFQSRYHVSIVAGQDHYALTISTVPAVTVSGRLVDGAGQPLASGSAIARSCDCTSASKRNGPDVGTFELVGVPRGEPAQLIIISDGKIGRFLRLSAEQTQADLNLGDITLEPIGGTSKALLIAAQQNMRTPGTVGTYTVVSEDGDKIMTVVVDSENGLPRTPWLQQDQGWLVPGRYYVIPGSVGIGRDETGWLLLDLIRAGKADDHPELLAFEALPNEETTVTVDAADVNAKIKAAAGSEQLTPDP